MAYKTIGVATFLVGLIASTLTAQEAAATKYSFILFPKGTGVRQAWVVPDRDGVDQQAMAEQHLPVNYVLDLDLIMYRSKSIEVKQLSIDELSQYAKLRTLDLSGSKVTNAELGKLVALKDLETLVLDHTGADLDHRHRAHQDKPGARLKVKWIVTC